MVTLQDRNDAGSAPGPVACCDAQHARGRLTARERAELLLDPGSAVEIDSPGSLGQADGDGGHDGVVTVRGRVAGRPVFLFAKDPSIHRGTLGAEHARRICALQRAALDVGAPIVGMFDTAGLRLESGMGAWNGYGEIVRNSAEASGVVPQVSLILGSCPGADALLPPLGDFVFMANPDSDAFVTGPDVVKAVTGEDVTAAELGGMQAHTTRSALADGAFDNDVLSILHVRRLLEFLPSSRRSGTPPWTSLDDAGREAPSLDTLTPLDGTGPYDVKELIAQVSDERDFLELQPDFAPNLVIGFARLEGRTVGIVANQAAVLAGVLDGDAARKGARFVRFCDAMSLPIVTFVDVPGFLPGMAQEHAGLARHASTLLAAYAQATAPRVTVVVRNALGAAGIAMGSRAIGADRVCAWPAARMGLVGADGAAALQGRAGDAASAAAYAQRALSPEAWFESGGFDEVIAPRRTRLHVVQALRAIGDDARASSRRVSIGRPV